MTASLLNVSAADADRMTRTPSEPVSGRVDGVPFTLRVAIPDYDDRVRNHYRAMINGDASATVSGFRHFGLRCSFAAAVELPLYDDDYMLDDGVRDLIKRFGPVIFSNAYLTAEQRSEGQRNIFPSHVFHFDRGPMHENRYSLFCRDPFDPAQREPRGSTTLIMPNEICYLQSLLEGEPAHEFRAQYTLFKKQRVPDLVDDILIEQCWNAPAGTGEVCVFDNRTVMHASYYLREAGYPIGVRYLF